jgi:predicted transcriptional regulator
MPWRYDAVMARTPTLVQLTDDLVALLDEEASERRLSRSALIREVLAEHLEERRKAWISDAIVDGYRRVPPAAPDAWGDVEQLTDQATADLLQRLDAEEERDGHGPW